MRADKMSPIHLACMRGNIYAELLLLRKGAHYRTPYVDDSGKDYRSELTVHSFNPESPSSISIVVVVVVVVWCISCSFLDSQCGGMGHIAHYLLS